MPWPLTKDELGAVELLGLSKVHFEDYLDNEMPPVRRFRATYRIDPSPLSTTPAVPGPGGAPAET